MDAEHRTGDEHTEEPPPLFPSWNTWYAVVFLNLIFLIVLFSIFTRVFE